MNNDFSPEAWTTDSHSFEWRKNGEVVGRGPVLMIEDQPKIKRLSRKKKKKPSKKAEKVIYKTILKAMKVVADGIAFRYKMKGHKKAS